jgi:pimeloyl-ACP methyl ester carboxylesterase
MRAMAERTPKAQFEVLDPCGHIASIERAQDFIGIAKAFLR